MSRGLGRLQQKIVETLSVTKQPGLIYSGGDNRFGGDKATFARVHNLCLLLSDDVYDLRAASHLLFQQTGRTQGCPDYPSAGFSACFSHAVRGLVRRGTLVPQLDVPCESVWAPYPYTSLDAHPEAWRISHVAIGADVMVNIRPYRQVRFVRVSTNLS